MLGRRCLILLMCTVLAVPVQAGIFGKKKPKVEPAQRVPELISEAKTSPDESKRADAVDELRKYEPAQFPDIVPALLDILQNDPKPSVRISALSSLSKFRPVSQEIGMALEQTLAKDTSMRVRLQARAALVHYHLAGYHSPKKDGPQLPPPDGKQIPPISTTPTNVPPPPPVNVPEPPIRAVPMNGAQRMPVGPITPIKITPVKRTRSDSGPDLGSPN